jgi:hypothetical protein
MNYDPVILDYRCSDTFTISSSQGYNDLNTLEACAQECSITTDCVYFSSKVGDHPISCYLCNINTNPYNTSTLAFYSGSVLYRYNTPTNQPTLFPTFPPNIPTVLPTQPPFAINIFDVVLIGYRCDNERIVTVNNGDDGLGTANACAEQCIIENPVCEYFSYNHGVIPSCYTCNSDTDPLDADTLYQLTGAILYKYAPPTKFPTKSPTATPTVSPTNAPTEAPIPPGTPTKKPTKFPTKIPTHTPTQPPNVLQLFIPVIDDYVCSVAYTRLTNNGTNNLGTTIDCANECIVQTCLYFGYNNLQVNKCTICENTTNPLDSNTLDSYIGGTLYQFIGPTPQPTHFPTTSQPTDAPTLTPTLAPTFQGNIGGIEKQGYPGQNCTFQYECQNGGSCRFHRCHCIYPWMGNFCEEIKDCVCPIA